MRIGRVLDFAGLLPLQKQCLIGCGATATNTRGSRNVKFDRATNTTFYNTHCSFISSNKQFSASLTLAGFFRKQSRYDSVWLPYSWNKNSTRYNQLSIDRFVSTVYLEVIFTRPHAPINLIKRPLSTDRGFVTRANAGLKKTKRCRCSHFRR